MAYGVGEEIDPLILECFERIGVLPDTIDVVKANSAIRSANLELSSWLGKGLNLFMVQPILTQLYPNQSSYPLSDNIAQVIDCVLTFPVRFNYKLINNIKVKAGTVNTSGDVVGNAEDIFYDGSVNCSVGPNIGQIAYTYTDTAPNIKYIGIIIRTSGLYSFSLIWTDLNDYEIGRIDFSNEAFDAYRVKWFVIEQSQNAVNWKISKNNNQTLPLFKIYLNLPYNQNYPTPNYIYSDVSLAPLTRQDYITIPNKNSSGRSTSYWFNAHTYPVINLWPCLNPQFFSATEEYASLLLMTVNNSVQTFDSFKTVTNIPGKFIDAFIAGVTARLAFKYAKAYYENATAEAQKAYQMAASIDTEQGQLFLKPDFSSY